jgi:hypothetical protein
LENGGDMKVAAGSYLPVQGGNPGSHLFDYFPNAIDLGQFDLQLVDLLHYPLEARNLGVGILDRTAGSVVLGLRRGLGLCVELFIEKEIHTLAKFSCFAQSRV